MNCDHCGDNVKAVFHAPGMADDQTWCAGCCDGSGFSIPFELLRDERELGRDVYARNLEAKKAKSLERLLFYKSEGRWPKQGELKRSEV